jgi:hypothetical protein
VTSNAFSVSLVVSFITVIGFTDFIQFPIAGIGVVATMVGFERPGTVGAGWVIGPGGETTGIVGVVTGHVGIVLFSSVPWLTHPADKNTSRIAKTTAMAANVAIIIFLVLFINSQCVVIIYKNAGDVATIIIP